MKKLIRSVIAFVLIAALLTACLEQTQGSAQQTMQQQNQKKADLAARMMEKTQVPSINESLERQNIHDRIIITNNANTLQWVYLFSAGRNIGRFPVRGKVTSGSKRLTSPEMFVDSIDLGDSWGQVKVEAPDEMGTYGASSPYIFWFDPAGQYHQWEGEYFLSPVPYQIDKQYGTVSIEVDASEEAKRAAYEKQIKETAVTK